MQAMCQRLEVAILKRQGLKTSGRSCQPSRRRFAPSGYVRLVSRRYILALWEYKKSSSNSPKTRPCRALYERADEDALDGIYRLRVPAQLRSYSKPASFVLDVILRGCEKPISLRRDFSPPTASPNHLVAERTVEVYHKSAVR